MAQAIQSILLLDRVAPADTVTARVYKRYFGIGGRQDDPDDDVAAVAKASLPPSGDGARLLNLAVLDLAAIVCKPVRPRCEECPLCDSCASAGSQFDRGAWRSGLQRSGWRTGARV
jgi:A/G-specific adenine glycosylase